MAARCANTGAHQIANETLRKVPTMDQKLEETLLALDWQQKDRFDSASGRHIETFEVNQSIATPKGSRSLSMKLIHADEDSYCLYLADRRVPNSLVTAKHLWQKIKAKLDTHTAMEETFRNIRDWLGLDKNPGADG